MELRGIKTYVIGLERDMAELKRNSSAQTATLIEQTAILREQNAILRSEMKKLRKEVARLSKRRRKATTESPESSDSLDDDSSDDDSGDDHHQATEHQPIDLESESEDKEESEKDSEATESLQGSESRILDTQSDLSTFTVRQIKDFLKRHGWTSARLNKFDIDTMRSEAVQIQLNLIQLLPEGTSTVVERDLMTSSRVTGLGSTLHPRKLPQPSKHRIVHWKFDGDKDCYMVKRITGDTQFFYSTYDLTRLTEEDLIELTDLSLQNDHEVDRAYAFERFLKKIKKENFDCISKKKTILKPKTREYLMKMGMTKEKMIKDQFLAIKPEQVPTQNAKNLLDNFKRWYLDDKTFQMVIEREEEEDIRIYHAAELNQFNLHDLEILATNPPEGKREWNKDLIEFVWKTTVRLYRRYDSAKPTTAAPTTTAATSTDK